MSVMFKVAEITSTSVAPELGGGVIGKESALGTTAQSKVRVTRMKKNFAANSCERLNPDTVRFVSIPDHTVEGDKLSLEEWQSLFWQASDDNWVWMWTQSGIKSRSFVQVRRDAFEAWADRFDRQNDAERFAAYAALAFSDVTDTEPLKASVEIAEPADGKDGNNYVPPAAFGSESMQFRAVEVIDGLPGAIAKGIGTPYSFSNSFEMDTNQVKIGGSVGDQVTLDLYRNAGVSARRKRTWISSEPTLMLRDNQEVRDFLAASTARAVNEWVTLLEDGRRVDLLKKLGGLHVDENGQLETALRAVIEALRSNLPMCQEVESRIARFAVREITQKIIPSGGIFGWSSLLVISDEYGAEACEWEHAKCFAFRMPVTGSDAIVPLAKDPYVKGIGYVVHSSVAQQMSGDADGDRMVVVKGPAVGLFRTHLNTEIVSGLKPEKAKANSPLTAERLEELALEIISQDWLVGALTVAGWKFAQSGNFEAASKSLELANIAPMLSKHHVEIEGRDFADYAASFLWQHKDGLNGTTLEWRQAGKAAQGWASLRELAGVKVDVNSHIDYTWNVASRVVETWCAEHPNRPLGMARTGKLVLGQTGLHIPASAAREKARIVKLWGSYWSNWFQMHDAGEVNWDAHETLLEQVRSWGNEASVEALAALMTWTPSSGRSTGFFIKWIALFSTGRAHEVLGYHEQVQQYLDADRDARAIVAAWIQEAA